jgi:hypothetical protein
MYRRRRQDVFGEEKLQDVFWDVEPHAGGFADPRIGLQVNNI